MEHDRNMDIKEDIREEIKQEIVEACEECHNVDKTIDNDHRTGVLGIQHSKCEYFINRFSSLKLSNLINARVPNYEFYCAI